MLAFLSSVQQSICLLLTCKCNCLFNYFHLAAYYYYFLKNPFEIPQFSSGFQFESQYSFHMEFHSFLLNNMAQWWFLIQKCLSNKWPFAKYCIKMKQEGNWLCLAQLSNELQWQKIGFNLRERNKIGWKWIGLEGKNIFKNIYICKCR